MKNRNVALLLSGALLVAGSSVRASEQELLDKIKALEARVAEMEGKAVTTNSVPAETLAFLGQTKISGYVSASFFHNFNDGAPGNNLYVTRQDQFAANKFKLALEKPVDYSPDKWNAGFRADLVVGEDAKVIHAAGLGTSDQPFDLEQAFITVNAPVGNGLKFMFGKSVTMMGVEVVEETVNPNWTIGNQFKYVENTTHTGAHVMYKLSDKVEVVAGVINGWDVVTDNNGSPSFMGKVNVTLSDATSVMLLGYGGPEAANDNVNWRKGAEVILTQKIGPKFTTYTQLDYGQEDFAGTSGADWYAAGFWGVYQFSPKVGLALRADYLSDGHSSRTAGYSANNNTDLTSLTATLNFTPSDGLQIRPEIRWDHSSEAAFADGTSSKSDQVIIGLGAAYLF